MAKNFKSSTKNTITSGRNIYKDKHGNTIYYNKKNNIAYRIVPAKENTFSTYQSRYVLVAIAFVLFYILFKLSIYISIALSATVLAFLEYQYRKFLRNCPQSKGFVKQERIKPIDQMIDTSIGGLILRTFLYAALAILLVINTFISTNVKGNTALEVTSYIVAIMAIYMAYKYFSLVIRKKAGTK